MKRHRNDGLKKRCTCSRRTWPKCQHGWHFGFHHGGKEWRYGLDRVATLRGEPKPRTKGEAQAWTDRLRGEIRSGVDPIAPSTPTVPSTGLTFGDLCDHYIREHVEKPTRRPNAINEMRYQIAALRRPEIPGPGGSLIKAETKPSAAVTKADVEAIRANRRRHAEQARVEWAAFDATHAAYLEAVRGDEKPQKPAHPAVSTASSIVSMRCTGGRCSRRTLPTDGSCCVKYWSGRCGSRQKGRGIGSRVRPRSDAYLRGLPILHLSWRPQRDRDALGQAWVIRRSGYIRAA